MFFTRFGRVAWAISAGVGWCTGFSRTRRRWLTPSASRPNRIRHGMSTRMATRARWKMLRLVRYSGSEGAGPPDRKRSTLTRNRPSRRPERGAEGAESGRIPAYTMDSHNFRKVFIRGLLPLTQLSYISVLSSYPKPLDGL